MLASVTIQQHHISHKTYTMKLLWCRAGPAQWLGWTALVDSYNWYLKNDD